MKVDAKLSTGAARLLSLRPDEIWPISTRVNKPENDDEQVLDPGAERDEPALMDRRSP